MRHVVFVGAAVAAALLVPAAAEAQQRRRPARRQPTIEIRGQVPTPQVVTVRPREVPTYNRRVLTPNFYDRNFWPSILPGYQLVSRRELTGAVLPDTTGRAGPAGQPPAASPRAGQGQPGLPLAPADSSARPAPVSGDTTRTTGTPPAPRR
ncbi:MAG TPA: hypothetical protein VNA89_07260 [Gemmatimonadaceae bacterium]|nr:hypothetical protein [Gemmatimonadaceae bacterium]